MVTTDGCMETPFPERRDAFDDVRGVRLDDEAIRRIRRHRREHVARDPEPLLVGHERIGRARADGERVWGGKGRAPRIDDQCEEGRSESEDRRIPAILQLERLAARVVERDLVACERQTDAEKR